MDLKWQLQEAKQKFSEVVRQALKEGPQIVTRHGEPVVVVLAAGEFERLSKPKMSFDDFLLSGPDFEPLELDNIREELRRDYPREVEL